MDPEAGVEVIVTKHEITRSRSLTLSVLYVEETERSLLGVSSNTGCHEIGEDYSDVRVKSYSAAKSTKNSPTI